MTRALQGAFIMSLIYLWWHVKLRHVVYGVFRNGDAVDWHDACKQPTYRYWNGGVPNGRE